MESKISIYLEEKQNKYKIKDLLDKLKVIAEPASDFKQVDLIIVHRGDYPNDVEWLSRRNEILKHKKQNTLFIIISGDYRSIEKGEKENEYKAPPACFLLENLENVEKFITSYQKQKTWPMDILFPQIIKFLALLKHRIAHCFLAIDIDLQGIAEVYKEEQKGQRPIGDAEKYFAEAFQSKTLTEKLEKARKLVEGDTSASDEIEKKGIKGIVNEIIDNEVKKKADKEFQEIRKVFDDSEIKELSEAVNNKGFEGLKPYLKPNLFHNWFCVLDEAIDNLRKTLPKQ